MDKLMNDGPTRIQIQRLDSVTPEEFKKNYIEPQRPVVLSRKMEGWGAVQKWTPEYFKKNFGDVVLRGCINLPPTAVPSKYRWKDYLMRMKMSDFVDLMYSASQPCYFDSAGIHHFPGEEKNCRFHELLESGTGRTLTLLWIGSAGTHSGLHFDRYNNIFGQVYGRKVVCLLAPDQAKYLYQFKDVVQKSEIDPEEPNLQKYPKFRNATVMHGLLEPRDILYIPKLWWHSLRALDHSVSINHWFGQDAGLKELLPLVNSAGIRAWITIALHFFLQGLLGRPFDQRLLCEEPNGYWLYVLTCQAIRRRLDRWHHSQQRS